MNQLSKKDPQPLILHRPARLNPPGLEFQIIRNSILHRGVADLPAFSTYLVAYYDDTVAVVSTGRHRCSDEQFRSFRCKHAELCLLGLLESPLGRSQSYAVGAITMKCEIGQRSALLISAPVRQFRNCIKKCFLLLQAAKTCHSESQESIGTIPDDW